MKNNQNKSTQDVQEKILTIEFERSPTHKSQYGITGYAPMWEVGRHNGIIYLVNHCRTMVKNDFGYMEVNGYRIEKVDEKTGKLSGQSQQFPMIFDCHDKIFLELLNKKYEEVNILKNT